MIAIKQGAAPRLPVRLLDTTGAALTGVAAGAVTCYLLKASGAAAPKIVTSGNWAEPDSVNLPGLYTLTLAAGDTDVVGPLVVGLTSAGADPFQHLLDVVEELEADTYARLGEPAGASLAADLLDLHGDVDDVATDADTAATQATAAASSAATAASEATTAASEGTAAHGAVDALAIALADVPADAGTAATEAGSAHAAVDALATALDDVPTDVSAAAVEAAAAHVHAAAAEGFAETAATRSPAGMFSLGVALPPSATLGPIGVDATELDWTSTSLRSLGYLPYYAGDDWEVRLQLLGADGAAADLTEWLIVMAVATSPTNPAVLLTRRSDAYIDPDADVPRLQIEIDADQSAEGGTATAPTGRGCLTMRFGSEAVDAALALAAVGVRPFGVRAVDGADVVRTKARGKLEVCTPLPADLDVGEPE